MKKRWQAGDSTMEGLAILAVLMVIIFTMPKSHSTNTAPGSTVKSGGLSWLSSENYSPIKGSTVQSSTDNNYSSIYLGTGNAAYSYQPYEEYITIENYGQSPIDITDWQLKNGKDKRPYYQGGSLQRFSADIAIIPRATRVLSPTGNNVFENVVLSQGDRAIITTGSIGVTSPYRIVSFKENMCTGYIENLSDYSFNPPLNTSCPNPGSEPGIENLPTDCRDAVRNLSSCQTPRFENKDSNGEPCDTCLGGKRLPTYCAAFIKEHFTYQGCLANHLNDRNFSGNTWRIFLGRGWEMWNKDYETVELFNKLGQLVTFQNY
ncbi:lamin tail domain-containing protein [Candidatus Parcubacteria bacterium]|nr:lamin tail domain-containing protein [Candidatus Parcubacteria bacterium]